MSWHIYIGQMSLTAIGRAVKAAAEFNAVGMLSIQPTSGRKHLVCFLPYGDISEEAKHAAEGIRRAAMSRKEREAEGVYDDEASLRAAEEAAELYRERLCDRWAREAHPFEG